MCGLDRFALAARSTHLFVSSLVHRAPLGISHALDESHFCSLTSERCLNVSRAHTCFPFHSQCGHSPPPWLSMAKPQNLWNRSSQPLATSPGNSCSPSALVQPPTPLSGFLGRRPPARSHTAALQRNRLWTARSALCTRTMTSLLSGVSTWSAGTSMNVPITHVFRSLSIIPSSGLVHCRRYHHI